jgi:hypothetical protein
LTLFWSRAIPAEQRFRELEEGLKPDFIEIIGDPVEIQKLGFDLVRSAKREILILFSTVNSLRRQEEAGLMKLLIDAASKNDITIRILTHLSNETRRIADSLKTNEKFEVKFLQRSLQSRLTTLVIDRKLSLEVEIKDDTKDSSFEAVGLAIYSNSESTVWTHASIFETLWMRSELRKITDH